MAVGVEGSDIGTSADKNGFFSLDVPENQNLNLIFQHINYEVQKLNLILKSNETKQLEIILENLEDLDTVTIVGNKINRNISIYTIPVESFKKIPSPFSDFNALLKTLGPVVSNSELSSTYSVRGGNFDENLVYVDNIQIYRPFLTRTGQQEGLSFINPDLVESVEFSAGGWQAQYGDKLSSMLNIQYKKPTEWGGSASLGLLVNQLHFEGVSKNKKLSFIAGARHKNSQYLLNTLPTEGEYLPRFYDVQSYLRYNFSERTKLDFLFSYARNRYLIEPATRETSFGTINQTLSLTVAFEGLEIMEYDLWQNSAKLLHNFGADEKLQTQWIATWVRSNEREFREIEGGYRLCEVVPNPTDLSQGNFCVTEQDIGTVYQHSRNRLKINVLSFENRSTYFINNFNQIDFGLKFSNEILEDKLQEFEFADSADYVTVNYALNEDLDLNSQRWEGYVQHSFFSENGKHTLNYGLRLGYWSINQEFLWSPRLQYSYLTDWEKPTVLKLAVGMYQQPPFYRELRNLEGQLNLDIRSQKSLHLIAGIESHFQIKDRDYKWTAETYYKSLWDVVPYDVDNVRIRYFADNMARAFATGVDFRVSGEFIKGAESWFSLGIMSTQEDLENDNQGFIRRPTDQRVTFAAYFEDYLKVNPTYRVNLNFVFGTGLPFGPPNSPEFRSALSAPTYRRVDVGFSKLISLPAEKWLESIWIGLDVLNILGVDNTISYTWVTDVNQQQYAVPNTLSTRFLNLRVLVKW